MSKKQKKKNKGGPHYFTEPNTLRIVNCKRIPGERARKACREWNKYVKDVKAGRMQVEKIPGLEEFPN